MKKSVSVTAFATWTSGGVTLSEAPRPSTPGAPLAQWAEAAPLSQIHPRARRPHPFAKQLVQLSHALLANRAIRGEPSFDLARTGMVFGTRSGCSAADREFFEQCQTRGAPFGSPSTFVYTLPTAAPGEVAIALGLRGGLETLTTESASGLAAVESAVHKVARGALDAALCGGFELPRTVDGKDSVADATEYVALFLVEPSSGAPSGAPSVTLAPDARSQFSDVLELAAWLGGNSAESLVLGMLPRR